MWQEFRRADRLRWIPKYGQGLSSPIFPGVSTPRRLAETLSGWALKLLIRKCFNPQSIHTLKICFLGSACGTWLFNAIRRNMLDKGNRRDCVGCLVTCQKNSLQQQRTVVVRAGDAWAFWNKLHPEEVKTHDAFHLKFFVLLMPRIHNMVFVQIRTDIPTTSSYPL